MQKPSRRFLVGVASAAVLLQILACGLLGNGSNEESPTTVPATETTGDRLTYYVAAGEQGASDSNNGLYPTYQGGQDGPWLTIQHAAETMRAGDTTLVRAGTYFESDITFAHSGTSNAPITLSRYAEEEVVLDGSQSENKSSGIQISKGQGHYVIQGFEIRDMPRSGIATDGSTSQTYPDITIRDCMAHDNGLSGFRLAAVDGFLVENVEAYGNAYYGMEVAASDNGKLSSANGEVKGSSFHDHTGEEGHGFAINQGHDIQVSDSVAYHNTIHGFDVSDMPKKGELSHDITLVGNLSYDNGVSGFSVNSDSHHVLFLRNVAWRNGGEWSGHGSAPGFICYNGCWHVEWDNNVSAENTDAGFRFEDPPGKFGKYEDTMLIYKNNIAFDNDSRHLWAPAFAIMGDGLMQVIATNNIWHVPAGQSMAVYNQGTQYTPEQINSGLFQTGNLSINPLFINPAEHDFHLQPGSPCIDTGVDIGQPYLGPAPDMGAYEFE